MKKYLVKTSTNFSIEDKEFYLQSGQTVDLPDHELIEGMVIHGHLVEAPPLIKQTTKL